jgi:hypothetical protein
MTMFYVEKPESQPRAYELTDTVPAPSGPYRRYITKFEQTPAFIVHSKMHGTHEKPQPYVVRGVSKRGELLVQATVETKYEPIGRWLEVECGDTQEGYRFKRRLLKPIATLIKIAADAAKANARVQKQQAHQADRDEKCGECPACFGDYVVVPTNAARLKLSNAAQYKMVHHGYERPGDGMIHGDCYGVGYAPFEVSCEGTKFYCGIVQNSLQMRQDVLTALPMLETVKVEDGSKFVGGRFWPVYKEIKRGEYGFDAEIALRRRKLESQIDSARHHLAELNKKIANWKPQPFPRPIKKGKTS